MSECCYVMGPSEPLLPRSSSLSLSSPFDYITKRQTTRRRRRPRHRTKQIARELSSSLLPLLLLSIPRRLLMRPPNGSGSGRAHLLSVVCELRILDCEPCWRASERAKTSSLVGRGRNIGISMQLYFMRHSRNGTLAFSSALRLRLLGWVKERTLGCVNPLRPWGRVHAT